MIEFPFKFKIWNEDRAWTVGCLWLSLDRFERFWPDVGLTLSNGAAVKSAIRAALRVEYAIAAAGRATEEDDMYYTARLEALARVCLREICETAGDEDAECIVRWMTGPVFGGINESSSDQHRWHRTWCNLFHALCDENPNKFASIYKISEEAAQQIVDIATADYGEVVAMETRAEEADNEPLSGWDAIAYAEYRWECSDLSPFDGLRRHIRYVFFDRSWAKILHCTRATDLDGLIQWGRVYAATRSPGSIQDEDVIIPDDVRAGWSDLHAKAA
jgi:hypothetical protein